MSKRKPLRRMSVLVTPQTLYHLRELAAAAGYGDRGLGKVVDKLTRIHMEILHVNHDKYK